MDAQDQTRRLPDLAKNANEEHDAFVQRTIADSDRRASEAQQPKPDWVDRLYWWLISRAHNI